MYTIKKCYLPEMVNYNNKAYEVNIGLSSDLIFNKKLQLPKDAIKVEVLSRKLKGKHDIHGQLYTPSIWIFTVVEPDQNKRP